MQNVSQIKSYKAPANFAGIKNFDASNYKDLEAMGIDVSAFESTCYAMDSLQATQSIGSIATPIQFLQEWLPGAVLRQTQAKKIDMVAGLTIAGSFEDEEVVQRAMEYTGQPILYSDYANTPLSSWNSTYESRTVVRFEEGVQIGDLEQARSSRAQIDDAGEKRKAAAEALERLRNTIGFFGFNNGLGRTYGLLNDPSLLPYITASTKAAGGTAWSNGTFLEIQKDILFAIQTLRTQTGDNVDPGTTQMVMAIATSSVDYLATTADLGGVSVREWLDKTYKNITVVSVPEFDAAVGGENVFYLYPSSVDDGSTDDGKVLDQLVQVKFKFNGSFQNIKVVTESYSMATAGIMVKRPIDVVRMSGN